VTFIDLAQRLVPNDSHLKTKLNKKIYKKHNLKQFIKNAE